MTARLQSSPPLAGEQVAFTGTLATMTHREASELTARHGGTATEHVSRSTTLLVVGEQDFPLEPDGEPTQKVLQFFRNQDAGHPGRILSESQWLTLLGLHDVQQNIRKLHTTHELARLLQLPAGSLRRWERSGLIRPVKRIHRLSYFDFAEVNVIRRLSELLTAGVSSDRLKQSLSRIRHWLPHVERPLSQLDVLVQDKAVFYRDEHSLVETRSGQRHLDFPEETQTAAGTNDNEPPATLEFPQGTAQVQNAQQPGWSAERWFQEGCALADADDLASAVLAFRASLLQNPHDAVTHFYLGEALYRDGRTEAACERFYAAIETDHNYVEAWRQLGSVLDELGDTTAAVIAFQTALNIYPDYADVHGLLATLLDRLNNTTAALPHWQAILTLDPTGYWANDARERLSCRDTPATRHDQDSP